MRRPGWGGLAGLSAALLLCLPAPALAAQVVAGRPAQVVSAENLQLALTGQTPAIPQLGDIMTLTATVTNRAAVALSDLSALVVYDPQRFNTRSALDAYATDTGGFGFAAPEGPHPLPTSTLPAGASETFRATVPVAELGLTQIGSYAFGLQVTGFAPGGFEVTSTARSFLPWWPLGSLGTFPPTPVSWLWPVVSQPQGDISGTLTDAGLARQLQPAGRLSVIVTAGAATQALTRSAGRPAGQPPKPRPAVLPTAPVPLDWVVDPMLLDEVRSVAAGYSLHGRPGPGRLAATNWLHALTAAVGGGVLIALPYADPDLVAENRAGLDNEFRAAAATGAAHLHADLGRSSLPGYLWPPGGALDQATADELSRTGYQDVIVSDAALPPASQLFTHSALSRIPAGAARPLTAFVTDSVLSSVIAAGASAGPAGQLFAENRYLAESLFIDYEYPLLRALVLAPPRRWNPPAAYATALLQDTAHAPWLTAMTLPQIAADPSVNVANRLPLTYPASARAAELPHSYLAAAAGTQHRLNELAGLIDLPVPRDPLVTEAQLALLRTLSASWRGDLAGGTALRQALAGEIDGLLSGVAVFSAGLVTFTSQHGTVPLTISNRLPEPVAVTIRLTAPEARIVAPPGTLTVAAGQVVQRNVALSLQTAGVFPLEVQLATSTGELLGAPVQLRIQSTAYGAIAVGITAGACALLLLAVAVRLGRRLRNVRRARI